MSENAGRTQSALDGAVAVLRGRAADAASWLRRPGNARARLAGAWRGMRENPRRAIVPGAGLAIVALESPEPVEAAVKGRKILGAPHEDRAQTEIHLGTVGHIEVVEGAHGVGDVDEGDREPVLAEHTPETHNRRSEVARRH